VTATERLQRAEELVARLHAEGRDLNPERKEKLERLRLLAAVERIFPGCRIMRRSVGGGAFMEKPMTKCVETPCTACGRRSWWRSIYGAVVCGVCHPPSSAELASAWLGEHDG
jgi:hypothetical protein